MTTTRVPAAWDAVSAALRAQGLLVWDGPVTTGDYSSAVFVGYDGDPDGDRLAVPEWNQEWAGLGKNTRDETFDLACAVVTLIGAGGVIDARDATFAILDTVGTVLRADPSLGQPPPFVAEFQPGLMFIDSTQNGWQCRIPFAVHVSKSRI